MSRPTPDGEPLDQWLRRQPRTVRDLLDHARLLADINRSLLQWCSEPWVDQIRIANLRDGTLVVFSASAAALVPLRYRSADLLAWINSRFQPACTRIEAKVRPA